MRNIIIVLLYSLGPLACWALSWLIDRILGGVLRGLARGNAARDIFRGRQEANNEEIWISRREDTLTINHGAP